MPEKELNLIDEPPVDSAAVSVSVTPPFNLDRDREGTRGDLARGLLWLLTFVIGGILAFVGLGRLDGTVITQSIFPSLVALAGTALGFYFGSQSRSDSTGSNGNAPLAVAATPSSPVTSTQSSSNQTGDISGSKKQANAVTTIAPATAPAGQEAEQDGDKGNGQ